MKKEKINANEIGSVANTTYNISSPVVIEMLNPALLLMNVKHAFEHLCFEHWSANCTSNGKGYLKHFFRLI